jgi:hypothetical protein
MAGFQVSSVDFGVPTRAQAPNREPDLANCGRHSNLWPGKRVRMGGLKIAAFVINIGISMSR